MATNVSTLIQTYFMITMVLNDLWVF